MATTLFLNNVPSDVSRGRNDLNKAGSAVPWRAMRLDKTLSGVGVQESRATVAGPTDGLEPGDPALEWLSDPLNAVTISGTITFNICASQSSTMANTTVSVIVERLDKNLAVVSTIIDSSFTTELSGSQSDRQWTGSPTSTNMLKGERIRLRVYFDDGGGTMGSGYSSTLAYGSTQTSQNNPANSRITFTEDLDFLTTPSLGTLNKNTSTGPGSVYFVTRNGALLIGDSNSGAGTVSYRSSLSGGETSNFSAQLTSIVVFDGTWTDNGTYAVITGTGSGSIPRMSTATSLAGPMTSRSLPTSSGSISEIVYGGDGYWVAIGGLTQSNAWILYVDTNPTNAWTQTIFSGPTNRFSAGDYGNGYWVVGGANNELWAINGTPNGTWTSVSSGLTAGESINNIKYANGYFMVENTIGETAYAADPTGTWTVGPRQPAGSANTIVAGGLFLKNIATTSPTTSRIFAKKMPWDPWRLIYLPDTTSNVRMNTDGTNLVMCGTIDNEIHYVNIGSVQALYQTAVASDIADQGGGVTELELWTDRGNG